jgi:hypothetical protein
MRFSWYPELSYRARGEIDNTYTETLIIPDITKTEFNNCFIIHCIFINNYFDKQWFVAQNNVWFSKKAVKTI